VFDTRAEAEAAYRAEAGLPDAAGEAE